MVDKPPQHNDYKLTDHDNNTRKIFVGGLSWNTTEDGLRTYFEKYGQVQEVVIMRDKFTGRSRGFGFVTFVDDKVISQVIADTHTLDGRSIEAKRAIPRGEITNRTKKIFVGGVPLTTTEEEFRSYFEQFGKISESQIIKDRMTGRSRGFGFVTFESDTSVEKVLSLSHQIGGKKVEVKKAEPRKRIYSPRYVWQGFPSPQLPFPNFPYLPSFFGYLPPNYRGNFSEMTYPYFSPLLNSPGEGNLSPASPSQQQQQQQQQQQPSPSSVSSPHPYSVPFPTTPTTSPLPSSPSSFSPLSPPQSPIQPFTFQEYFPNTSHTSFSFPTFLTSPSLATSLATSEPTSTTTTPIITATTISTSTTSTLHSLSSSSSSSTIVMSSHLSPKTNNNNHNHNTHSHNSSTASHSINNLSSPVNAHTQRNSKYHHNR